MSLVDQELSNGVFNSIVQPLQRNLGSRLTKRTVRVNSDEVFSTGTLLALLFSAPRSVVVLAGEEVAANLCGIVPNCMLLRTIYAYCR